MLVWVCVEGADPSQRVENLPGQPAVQFEQYAGYVTVHEAKGRALFYWFVEADHKKASSLPISFWFNGGLFNLTHDELKMQEIITSSFQSFTYSPVCSQLPKKLIKITCMVLAKGVSS